MLSQKSISMLQWLEQFNNNDEITRQLDEIDNKRRLSNYKR